MQFIRAIILLLSLASDVFGEEKIRVSISYNTSDTTLICSGIAIRDNLVLASGKCIHHFKLLANISVISAANERRNVSQLLLNDQFKTSTEHDLGVLVLVGNQTQKHVGRIDLGGKCSTNYTVDFHSRFILNTTFAHVNRCPKDVAGDLNFCVPFAIQNTECQDYDSIDDSERGSPIMCGKKLSGIMSEISNLTEENCAHGIARFTRLNGTNKVFLDDIIEKYGSGVSESAVCSTLALVFGTIVWFARV